MLPRQTTEEARAHSAAGAQTGERDRSSLYPDDLHEIRQHPHGRFRTMNADLEDTPLLQRRLKSQLPCVLLSGKLKKPRLEATIPTPARKAREHFELATTALHRRSLLWRLI